MAETKSAWAISPEKAEERRQKMHEFVANDLIKSMASIPQIAEVAGDILSAMRKSMKKRGVKKSYLNERVIVAFLLSTLETTVHVEGTFAKRLGHRTDKVASLETERSCTNVLLDYARKIQDHRMSDMNDPIVKMYRGET